MATMSPEYRILFNSRNLNNIEDELYKVRSQMDVATGKTLRKLKYRFDQLNAMRSVVKAIRGVEQGLNQRYPNKLRGLRNWLTRSVEKDTIVFNGRLIIGQDTVMQPYNVREQLADILDTSQMIRSEVSREQNYTRQQFNENFIEALRLLMDPSEADRLGLAYKGSHYRYLKQYKGKILALRNAITDSTGEVPRSSMSYLKAIGETLDRLGCPNDLGSPLEDPLKHRPRIAS